MRGTLVCDNSLSTSHECKHNLKTLGGSDQNDFSFWSVTKVDFILRKVSNYGVRWPSITG
jgi:hypothetical protein